MKNSPYENFYQRNEGKSRPPLRQKNCRSTREIFSFSEAVIARERSSSRTIFLKQKFSRIFSGPFASYSFEGRDSSAFHLQFFNVNDNYSLADTFVPRVERSFVTVRGTVFPTKARPFWSISFVNDTAQPGYFSTPSSTLSPASKLEFFIRTAFLRRDFNLNETSFGGSETFLVKSKIKGRFVRTCPRGFSRIFYEF